MRWICDCHKTEKLFDRLVKEANKSHMFQSSRHACAIVWRNKVLAIGHNRAKTHPAMRKHQPNPERVYLHAEVDAIIKTMNRYGSDILQDCSLYVIQVGKLGTIGNSKPCAGCQNMINSVGIRYVFWSEKEGAEVGSST